MHILQTIMYFTRFHLIEFIFVFFVLLDYSVKLLWNVIEYFGVMLQADATIRSKSSDKNVKWNVLRVKNEMIVTNWMKSAFWCQVCSCDHSKIQLLKWNWISLSPNSIHDMNFLQRISEISLLLSAVFKKNGRLILIEEIKNQRKKTSLVCGAMIFFCSYLCLLLSAYV